MAQQDAGTKVLLPEEESAPASPKRRFGVLYFVVGGTFALILILGLLLQLVGHKSGTSAATTGQSQSGSSTGGTTAAASGGATANSATQGAAQSTRDGIPVGYPHSQSGAISAAVNYEMARSTASYFTNTASRNAVLSVIMAPESLTSEESTEAQTTASVLSNLGLSQGQTSSLMVRSAPMGDKVDAYASNVTTVEVWMAGVVGVTDNSSALTPTASWDTYTYTLTWINGDWKAESISAADGPTPLSNNQTPTPVQQWANISGNYNEPPYTG